MKRHILDTKGRQLLGTKYPIIQAGMGHLATGDLAAAVSQAGGLGVIAARYFSGEELRAEIRKVREQTDNPFGVNILLYVDENGEYFPDIQEHIAVSLEEKVPVITTGLGDPTKLVELAHKQGTKVISLVGNVRTARKVEQAGVDAITAQGWEAGGHNSRVATMALVPQVVDAVNVPVFAAGGIGDGRGLLAALSLGATGVLCGTIFAACKEANAHINYKNKIVEIDDEGTTVTPALSGKPARMIKNAWTEYYEKHPEEILPFPKQWYKNEQAGLTGLARIKGDVENGPTPSGQIGGLVKGVRSAAEIIEEMVQQAERIWESEIYTR